MFEWNTSTQHNKVIIQTFVTRIEREEHQNIKMLGQTCAGFRYFLPMLLVK